MGGIAARRGRQYPYTQAVRRGRDSENDDAHHGEGDEAATDQWNWPSKSRTRSPTDASSPDNRSRETHQMGGQAARRGKHPQNTQATCRG